MYNENSSISGNLPSDNNFFEKDKKRIEVFTSIAGAYLDLTSDHKEMLAFTSRKLAELTNDLSVICLISEDGSNIDATVSCHPDEKIRNGFCDLLNTYPLNTNKGIISRIINNKLPSAVYAEGAKFNIPGLFSLEYIKFLKKYLFYGILSLPVKINNKIVGIIILLRNDSAFRFTVDEQIFLQSISGLLASVIMNSRLYKEKELLIREMHHRLKNNLQVISSLLSIQSDYVRDDESHKLFVNSLNRIRTMSMTHENLNQKSNYSGVEIDKYLKDLITYLCRTYNINTNRYKIIINIPPVSLSIDTSITTGLIINELISNAFKHAFPDGRSGKIKIDFIKSVKKNKLIVSDNGIGLPDKMNIESHNSFGLLLIRTLVDQLDGKMELSKRNGAKFIITFPDNSN